MYRCDYRGLCASTYDLLLPADAVGDLEFYRDAIVDAGEPALEIGCGTGRLLLAYLGAGLDVEGIDTSSAMLEICRTKARARGLTVRVHEQAAETLDLRRRFQTIYVPVGSFMLILDPDTARAALRRFLGHLLLGGRIIVPLGLPWQADVATTPAPHGEWRLRRTGVRPEDGAAVECWELATYEFGTQLKHAQLRYEVRVQGRLVQTEHHVLPLRWYTQEQFADLLNAAGFVDVHAVREHTWEPARREDAFFTFVARCP